MSGNGKRWSDIPYIRKTRDRWDIMTDWGYGWECEYSAYSYDEARSIFKDYRENSCGRFSVRMEKHRERIV